MKGRVNTLVLIEELKEESFDRERCFVVAIVLDVNLGLKLESCCGTFCAMSHRRNGGGMITVREGWAVSPRVGDTIVGAVTAVHWRQRQRRN